MRLITVISFFLILSSSAFASDCEKARQLFKQSNLSPENSEKYLEEAINLCPDYPEAINNLALIFENKGQLDKAAELYRKSIDINPDFCPALAGLGDIELTKGRLTKAAYYYDKFLSSLEKEKNRGDPYNLLDYEKEYRDKLKRVNFKNKILKDSATKIIPTKQIVKGLSSSQKLKGARGLVVPERLPMCILFDTASSTIKQKSKIQLKGFAEALKSVILANANILIEGHTDNYGTEDYNIDLSERRAASVRQYLIECGINPNRLYTKGFGETNLIIDSGTRDQQSINRRVEFVDIGPFKQ